MLPPPSSAMSWPLARHSESQRSAATWKIWTPGSRNAESQPPLLCETFVTRSPPSEQQRIPRLLLVNWRPDEPDAIADGRPLGLGAGDRPRARPVDVVHVLRRRPGGNRPCRARPGSTG